METPDISRDQVQIVNVAVHPDIGNNLFTTYYRQNVQTLAKISAYELIFYIE